MKGKIRLLGAWLGLVVGSASVAQGGYLTVYGAPAYDPNTGDGFLGGIAKMVNASGTAVGYASRYVNGTSMGRRAVRWDGSGGAGTELAGLGTDPNGYTSSEALAINASGTAVGNAYKYVNGNNMGARAVRWDASGTAATELGDLGTNPYGSTYADASTINDTGTAAGFAKKYVSGNSVGTRAVRWHTSGMAATELGNLGTDPNGFTYAQASAINDSGTAVGFADKYVNGNNMGHRAARWDASGMAATELGALGTGPNGFTNAQASAINDGGTAVGYASKYISGNSVGTRAVRWHASRTAATELGNLGTRADGYSSVDAYAINDTGMAVGYALKYVNGNSMGGRAVRWDASGTAATELGNLGTDPNGYTYSSAVAINASGMAVGTAYKYLSGDFQGPRAVLWGLDGNAVNLNNLIDPNSGWTLTHAMYISDPGWLVGLGKYDPDGAGGFDAYERLFLLQIPEPGTLSLLALGALGLIRYRRK